MNDDLISRQAAIEALAGWKISPIVLDPVPAADVRENVKGEWIERKPVHLGKVIKGLGRVFVCSVCGEEVDCKPYNFCPNCGARMQIAKQIIHDAIDNTTMAEDVFVGIKEKMHKAVDELEETEPIPPYYSMREYQFEQAVDELNRECEA